MTPFELIIVALDVAGVILGVVLWDKYRHPIFPYVAGTSSVLAALQIADMLR